MDSWRRLVIIAVLVGAAVAAYFLFKPPDGQGEQPEASRSALDNEGLAPNSTEQDDRSRFQDSDEAVPAVFDATTDGALLSGRVFDEATGAGIAGVALELLANFSPPPANENWQPVHTATSDTTGGFAFALEQPGVYRVGLAADEPSEPYTMIGTYDFVWRSGEDQPPAVDIPLLPGYAIRGRVVDWTGAPRGGVSVNAYNQVNGVFAAAESDDSDGTFVLHVAPPYAYGVTLFTRQARNSGGIIGSERAGPFDVPAEGLDGIEITVREGPIVHGRLIDEAGTPMAGYMLIAEHDEKDYLNDYVTTAADGSFTFRLREAGLHAVEASFGQETAPIGSFVAGLGEVIDDLELVLPHGATKILEPGVVARIWGRVLSPEGDPVPDAFVCGEPEGMDEPGSNVFATAEPDGTFVLGLRHDVIHDLTSDHEEWGHVQIKGVRPDTRDVTLTLRPLTQIEVRVTDRDSGAPITDCVLWSQGANTGRVNGRPFAYMKDNPPDREHKPLRYWHIYERRKAHGDRSASHNGVHILEGVEPGWVEVMAVAEGYAPGFAYADVGDDGTTHRVEIALEPEGVVRGFVTDSRGNPLRGAMIFVGDRAEYLADSHFTEAATRSDARGQFEIRGLPRGDAFLCAQRFPYSTTVAPVSVGGNSTDVRLVLGNRGGVTGTVWLAGVPVEGARVSIDSYGLSRVRERTTTDAGGQFVLDDLEPGEAEITVSFQSPGRYRYIRDRIAVGDGQTTPISVDFPVANSSIAGRVLVDGAAPAQIRIDFNTTHRAGVESFNTQIIQGDTYEVQHVPAGDVMARVQAQVVDGEWVSGEFVFSLGEGERLERDFELGSGR